ncbi:hypothetical protein MDAP_001854 [Mitosporidium daphniae]|uniref:Uncharacterized protein n=1 Tax=Mitosporidium daphniae TaxID=1485682 RepID=A0A098VR76_9MICR|nr:uncharacterized protein DI09_7p250 [Mitosporidium daphniae]KGG50246.1 hypothetical protein DI09_7p250 [Mitosporidium daphniae]|eukprot:XP_013236673.1 uncharacterized protein DI09_7p250 [Mitosporidium daphniae]
MIPPPTINTIERFDYDIKELQSLSEIANSLGVAKHPILKGTFDRCYEKAGFRGFSQECSSLSLLIMAIRRYRMATLGEDEQSEFWVREKNLLKLSPF